jgi:hypothetical protein
LNWCFPANTAEELTKFATLPVELRQKIWEKQKEVVEKTGKVDPLVL